MIAADPSTRWRSDADPSTAIVTAIARRTNTRAVILCGSRATGGAQPDSDYDVLAVMPLLAVPLRLAHLHAAARGVRQEEHRVLRPGSSGASEVLEPEEIRLSEIDDRAPRHDVDVPITIHITRVDAEGVFGV